MTKAIIFDMNGVIIDDEAIHELAFNKVLEKYDFQLSHQEYFQYCMGKTDRLGFEIIAQNKNINIDINRAIKDKNDYYLKLFPNHKKTYPDVIELIRSLSQNHKLGLCSGSVKEEVALVLKEFKVTDYFRAITTSEDITHSKPDPEPYLLTAQKLNILPDQCLVIEDSPSGVQSAKGAGMTCIGVLTTHKKEDLFQADVILPDFESIKKYIGEKCQ